MRIKDHIRFRVGDATQLTIALISSYGMWAATGFQKTFSALMYPILGFITGGLASRHNTSDPGVMSNEHIETPYVNNMKVTGVDEPVTALAPVEPVQTYQNVKIIPKQQNTSDEIIGGEI
jgi:hypothetical protein